MEFQKTFKDELKKVPSQFYKEDLFVPAIGNLDAEVMLVGEAPGKQEVKQGKPFVGRAGKVLNNILEELDVKRKNLYITNIVKIRPPNNRNPTKEEKEAWKSVLEAEIKKVNPKTLVTLGNVATKELLKTTKGISKIHGKIFQQNGWQIIPTFHPAATLYNPETRPLLKKDLMNVFKNKEKNQTTLDDL